MCLSTAINKAQIASHGINSRFFEVKEFMELYPKAIVEVCGVSIHGTFTDEELKEIRESFHLSVCVGLYDRYVLQMTIAFKMSPDQKAVTDFKVPEFRLYEVEQINVTPIAGDPKGQANINYTNFQPVFDYAKFKTLKANKGDFSSIEITLRKDAPVKNFDRAWKSEK
jgi:hypothetical protein